MRATRRKKSPTDSITAGGGAGMSSAARAAICSTAAGDALRTLVRLKAQQGTRKYRGKIALEGDLEASRRSR